jgi:hypothetical protein
MGIAGHYGHFLQLCLRNQQAVEWVAMVLRQMKRA